MSLSENEKAATMKRKLTEIMKRYGFHKTCATRQGFCYPKLLEEKYKKKHQLYSVEAKVLYSKIYGIFVDAQLNKRKRN